MTAGAQTNRHRMPVPEHPLDHTRPTTTQTHPQAMAAWKGVK
jgi:hypothetical protein